MELFQGPWNINAGKYGWQTNRQVKQKKPKSVEFTEPVSITGNNGL